MILDQPIDGIAWSAIQRYADVVATLPVNQHSPVWLANHKQIAKQAAAFAAVTFNDNLMRDNARDIHLTVAVSMLLYAVDHHGLSIDDISDNVGLTIARAVAQISGDPRVSYARRMWQVSSELAQAAKSSQLAALAEIVIRGPLVVDELSAGPLEFSLRAWVEAWLQGKQQILDGLHSLSGTQPYKAAAEVVKLVAAELLDSRAQKAKGRACQTCQPSCQKNSLTD